MIELIGYVSALLFALSGIPFAWSSYKAGRADVDLNGVLMILGGALGMLVYELGTARSIPQLIDFALVALCWSVVLRYKLWPRRGVK